MPTNNMYNAAEEAYQEARALFNHAFSSTEQPINFLTERQDINSLLDVLEQVQQQYHDRIQSKARKWLCRLSARINLYGNILDVLVQQSPEYVSLAWGAFKFLFVTIMNHEQMTKDLAKAVCRIADALLQAERDLMLYPTESMRKLLSALYAKIMKFVQRAIKWYKESKLQHVLSAIVRPYSLRFQDVVDDIADLSARIDRLALSMSMIELKATRSKLEEMQREQKVALELTNEMKRTLEGYHHLHYAGLIDTNKRVCEIQFSQIMTFTATSVLPSPEACRQYHRVRRNRRRQSGQDNSGILRDSKQLQAWANKEESHQIAICSNFQSRHAARDFAIDAIDLIKEAQIPVVWVLNPRNDSREDVTSLEVLKYLVSQVLQQNHTMLNERSAALSAARYQSATTEDDWISLLGSVLEGMSQIYMIVDLEILGIEKAERSWPGIFTTLVERLQCRNIRTVVKVAFVLTRSIYKATLIQDMDQRSILQIPTSRSGRVSKCRTQTHLTKSWKRENRLLSLASSSSDGLS